MILLGAKNVKVGFDGVPGGKLMSKSRDLREVSFRQKSCHLDLASLKFSGNSHEHWLIVLTKLGDRELESTDLFHKEKVGPSNHLFDCVVI